jgi:transcriptional antiterminator
MSSKKFKSRKIFADELGMSTKTLQRKLKAANYELPPGLISPEQQEEIWGLLDRKGRSISEQTEERKGETT